MTQPTVPPNDGRVTTHVATPASTGPFQIDFPFMNLGEIIVQIQADGALPWTTLIYGSQYSVAATPQEDGSYINGTVTLVTPVSNTSVTRFRNTYIQRLSNYPLQGYFDRLSLNAEMNRYVMCLQDFERRLVDLGGDTGGGGSSPGEFPLVQRVLQTPLSETPVIVTAGLIAVRAGRLLAWDNSGNLINSAVTVAQMEAVVGAGVPNFSPYAPLASPVFTGNPQAPTPAVSDNDTSIATTAFVRTFGGLGPTGSAGGDLTGSFPNPTLVPVGAAGSVGGTAKFVALTTDTKGRVVAKSDGDITPLSIGAAPINSPAFTGIPTAPTPAPPHSNDTSLATTQFVTSAISGMIGGSIPTGPAGGDLDSVTTYPNPLIKSDVGLRGAPTVVTVVPAANNNQTVATTKFVKDQAYASIAQVTPLIPLDGFFYGCTLSNSGTTGMIVSAGKVADTTSAVLITNVSPFTKLITATWAAGSGAGGRGTGVSLSANTWYHVFGGMQAGAFDVFFDTSVTGANKPAAFTAIRRLGSPVKTDGSSNIVACLQVGDKFLWNTPVVDMNTAPGATAVTRVLTVPVGLVVEPIVSFTIDLGGLGADQFYLSTLSQPDLAVSGDNAQFGISPNTASGPVQYLALGAGVFTNTLAQVRTRMSSGTGTVRLKTYGWIDTRGRLGP